MDQLALEARAQKPRHSGIDLLRVIALVMICVAHAYLPLVDKIDHSTNDAAFVILNLLTPLGVFGNIIFVTCSSYFLVDKTKSSADKAIKILMDSCIISWFFLVCYFISREPISWLEIVWQIFPDIFSMGWFVTCYVIFYLLAPIVVAGLKRFSRKQHFFFLMGSVVFYSTWVVLGFAPYATNLFGFFFILNIVAFIKWHAPSVFLRKKTNLLIVLIGVPLLYGLEFAIALLDRAKIDIFFNFGIFSFFSPFAVFPMIALFCLFQPMKFQSRFISYLSSCSLFVYLIHCNYFLRNVVRFRWYEAAIDMFGIQYAFIFYVVCAVTITVEAFGLSAIYKETFGRLTTFCSKKTAMGINIVMSKAYQKFFKEE